MRTLWIGLLALLPLFSAHAEEAMPRTILALYDSHEDGTPRTTRIHRMLEMPLNHLGYRVRYLDIQKPLPEPGTDVRGILVWFRPPTELSDPKAMLDWIGRAMDKGKRLVVFGHMGIGGKFRDSPNGMKELNRVLNRIGVNETNHRITITYESKIDHADRTMMGFERALELLYPPFFEAHRSDRSAVSYFRLRHVDNKETVSDLVVTGPMGGYVADDYGVYTDERSKAQQWYINPFLFFERAFAGEGQPKPDITTLDGRRIFYSQVDGDGWNNVTEVERYKTQKLITAQVATREIFSHYPDLPFNIGIITSELDPQCYGYPQSIPAAIEMLKLPNVEPSSHSRSHPLYWNYFADGVSAKEKPLLARYPSKPPRSLLQKMTDQRPDPWARVSADNLSPDSGRDPVTGENLNEVLSKYFGLPRSYACEPFDIDREIAGSIAYINTLAARAGGKPVRLFQWSGDTSPFPRALHKTAQAGVENINGGDTRYDAEYPSYSWVSPVGVEVGKDWQIFSSNSNENTYTHLWTNRFFGFRYLQTTVFNTDTPIRIKPFNIYFHLFSAEKEASLNAIKENLNFARTQVLIPVTASQYAAIGKGFFTAEFVPAGPDGWKILKRGSLNTVRFDRATLKAVDLEHSEGVLGQRHTQGSLYIALDPTADIPLIRLKKSDDVAGPPPSPLPYLIESRWNVRNLRRDTGSFTFETDGYGPGEMRWHVPEKGKYSVEARTSEKVLYKSENDVNAHPYLEIRLPAETHVTVQVTVTKL